MPITGGTIGLGLTGGNTGYFPFPPIDYNVFAKQEQAISIPILPEYVEPVELWYPQGLLAGRAVSSSPDIDKPTPPAFTHLPALPEPLESEEMWHPQGPMVRSFPPVVVANPFTAGDYYAAGLMTWTVAIGNLLCYDYWLSGSLMWLNIYISASLVAGVLGSYLRLKIPGGKTFKAIISQIGYYSQNAVDGMIQISSSIGDDAFYIGKTPLANWGNFANTVIGFQVLIEVN
jgi:hypothetical protein